jgi:hypothetical protein
MGYIVLYGVANPKEIKKLINNLTPALRPRPQEDNKPHMIEIFVQDDEKPKEERHYLLESLKQDLVNDIGAALKRVEETLRIEDSLTKRLVTKTRVIQEKKEVEFNDRILSPNASIEEILEWDEEKK